MANAFTLFGELRADATQFQKTLRDAEGNLKKLDKEVLNSNKRREQLAQKSALAQQKADAQSAQLSQRLVAQTENLRERLAQQTSQLQERLQASLQKSAASSALQQQKLTQQTELAKTKLAQQSAQFQEKINAQLTKSASQSELTKQKIAQQGAIAREKISSQEYQFAIKQANAIAKAQEAAQKRASSTSFTTKMGLSFTGGDLAAGAITKIASEFKNLAVEGVKLDASFDKLVRFTATLDKNLQSASGLAKLKADFQQLSTEIPQSADDIAKAAFTIKSAFSDLTSTQLVEYLREFGLAATASNTDIASHVENVAALAKQYGITANQLKPFNALIASSFGQALASDTKVAQGFNEILNTAKATKQPLNDVIAAMSTLQGASNNAAGNTTLLKGALEKLSDAKYQEGFKEIGINVFDASHNFRDFGGIINDVAKAMEGLSDEDIAKKFAFMKDQEARQGYLTLARGVKDFNTQLKNGGDLDAYGNKTGIMLKSTEARWKMFWANVENGQRGFGERMSSNLMSIFDQQTVVASIQAFIMNITAEFANGIVKIAQIGAQGYDYLSSSLNKAFSGTLGFEVFTTADEAKQEANTKKFFDGVYDTISKARNTAFDTLREEQITKFQELLATGVGTSEQKAAWKNSLKALGVNMQEGAKEAGSLIDQSGVGLKTALDNLSQNTNLSPELRKKLKSETIKIGDSVKEGATEAQKKIQASGKALQATLQALLGDSRISGGLKDKIRQELSGLDKAFQDGANKAKPNVENAGNKLGTSFVDFAVSGMKSKIPDLNNLQKFLVKGDTAKAASEGFKVGLSITQGIEKGIKWGTGEVIEASASAAKSSVNAWRKAIDARSPSMEFFEIAQDTIQGFVNGIEASKPKIIKSLGNAILNAVKNLKKELADALKDFNILTSQNPQIIETKTKLFQVNKQKGLAETLSNLRNETGINIGGSLLGIDYETEIFGLEKIKSKMDEVKKLRLEFGKDIGQPFGDLDKTLLDLMKLDETFGKIASSVSDFIKTGDLKIGSLKEYFQAAKDIANPEFATRFAEIAKSLGMTTEEYTRLATTVNQLKLGEILSKGNEEFEKLGDPQLTKLIEERADALQRMGEGLMTASGVEMTTPIGVENPNEMMDVDGAEPPGKLTGWNVALDNIKRRMGEIQNSLPSFQSSMEDVFVSLPERIGDIFGNAIENWDGTLKGFFKSVGQGFADLLKQVAAEIIKVLIIKGVTKLFGILMGSIGGGTAGHGGEHVGFASGGFTGQGSAMDVAGVVHKKEFVFDEDATRFWGLGNLNKMLNFSMPDMGFATGGYTGGSMSSNSYSDNKTTNQYNVTFNLPNVKNPDEFRRSGSQMARELVAMTDKHRG